MPAPLAAEVRAAIADDIRAGELGCRAIARKHQVAASTVSTIARHEGLAFDNDWMTTTATDCRRYYAEIERGKREDALIEELLSLPQTSRARDGRETRAYRRISYALYNLRRHQGRQYR